MLSIVIAHRSEQLPRPITLREWCRPENRATADACRHWTYHYRRAEMRRQVLALRALRASPNFKDPKFNAWCARQEMLRLEAIRREFRTRPAAMRARIRRSAAADASIFASMVPWSESFAVFPIGG